MGGGYFRLRTLRKVILIFLILITLISVILIKTSQAKYQVGKTYENIVSGNVKNDVADFNLVSIYINGEKSLDNKVPINGYLLDLENTKCTVDNEELSDITFEYKYGKVGVYGINTSKTKCNIYFVDSPTKKIIDSSLGKLDVSHFSKTSCKNGTNNETHTEGNCQEETNGIYEEETILGKTYYYRGTVNNNWVKYGINESGLPIWWRIIRINEDGTIRLIYAGEGEETPVGVTDGYWLSKISGIENSSYKFNNSRDYNAYVGYMYGTENSGTFEIEHGYDLIDQNKQDELNDSNAKTIIDDWYVKNLADEGNVLSGKTGFCGDRSLAPNYEEKGYGTEETHYKGYNRLYISCSPTFECEDSAHDLYTTSNDKGAGNGALDYPIGLITADEVVYAGGQNAENYGFWLRTGSYFWTITPSVFRPNEAINLLEYPSGTLTGAYTNYLHEIRPTVNVFPEYFNTEEKDGTIENPYIVVTN